MGLVAIHGQDTMDNFTFLLITKYCKYNSLSYVERTMLTLFFNNKIKIKIIYVYCMNCYQLPPPLTNTTAYSSGGGKVTISDISKYCKKCMSTLTFIWGKLAFPDSYFPLKLLQCPLYFEQHIFWVTNSL